MAKLKRKKERKTKLLLRIYLRRTRLLCSQDSPGKNTGAGCHSLLQGIFPIQGSNLGLLHCRQILYSQIKQRVKRKEKKKELGFES